MLGKPDSANPHPWWLQAMRERGYDVPAHKPGVRLRHKIALVAATITALAMVWLGVS